MEDRLRLFTERINTSLKEYALTSSQLDDHQMRAGSFMHSYIIKPKSGTPIPLEVLVSKQEILVTPGKYNGIEFWLSGKEKPDEQTLEKAFQLIKSLIEKGCIEEIWSRDSRIVASRITIGKNSYSHTSLRGLIKIGLNKERIAHPPYEKLKKGHTTFLTPTVAMQEQGNAKDTNP